MTLNARLSRSIRSRIVSIAAVIGMVAAGVVLTAPAASAATDFQGGVVAYTHGPRDGVTTIGVGDRPNGVAASDGRVYVTNYGSDTVSVISQASNTVTATINVGGGPGAVAADGGHVYVANQADGTVSVINQTTNKVTATINVGGIPIYMAVGGGHVYVADGSVVGRVSAISQATNKVTATINVGGAPNWMAVGSGHLYVTNDNSLVAISQATNKVTATIKVGKAPGDIAIDDGHVYVANYGDGTVSVINQATNKVTATFNVGKAPGYMAVGGGHVYVTNYYDDTVTVAAVPTGCHPFPDVGASNLHCGNIEWLAGQGITKPMDGNYHPTSNVTRGSMAAFLFRLENPGQSSPKCTGKPFPDVKTSNVFCGYIQWAGKTGVAQGYPDGMYKPGNGVTRGAMAAFMQRIAVGHPAPKCTSKPFNDVAMNSTFCKPIAWMVNNKITFGVGDGSNYGTTQIVNRQSMASFLHRIYDYMH